mgnify:CR=1 FL=1
MTNLLKSLVYILLYNINKTLTSFNNLTSNYKSYISKNITNYNTVVKTITIFLYKNNLTKLLYYILNIITTSYTNPRNSLEITTNNLLINKNFQFFIFFNLFYFKIRNY